ncbi:MAG: hypothetical protein V7724_03130 [Sediminicola sp.]
MKSSQILGFTLLALVFGTTSCTKSEESLIEENIDGTYLQFSTSTSKDQNDRVLYSNWGENRISAIQQCWECTMASTPYTKRNPEPRPGSGIDICQKKPSVPITDDFPYIK